MAKTTLEVSMLDRNVILKNETKAQLRQIAKTVLAIESNRLLELLGQGMVVGNKIIKIVVENAENTSDSNVEIL